MDVPIPERSQEPLRIGRKSTQNQINMATTVKVRLLKRFLQHVKRKKILTYEKEDAR